jgi:hypothetical protein
MIANAESSQQIIDRLHLQTPNLNLQIGKNCLLPGFNHFNPKCILPLNKTTDFLLSLQDSGSRIEAVICDAKLADQFQNYVCTVTRMVEVDNRGCPYQDAKFEVSMNAGEVKLVSRSPYVYRCD